MSARQRLWLALLAGGLLVVAAGVVVGAGVLLERTLVWPRGSQREIEATIDRGDAVFSALEAYRADHGEYPSDLDALTPVYLSSIEPPLVGAGRWVYRRRSDGCWLATVDEQSRDVRLVRQSGWADWAVDTK